MLDIVNDIVKGFDNLFTSDEERLEAEKKILDILSKHDSKAHEINLLEATGNVLQRAWRPLLAYVCIFGFAYSTIIAPIFGLKIVAMAQPIEMLYYLLGYSGLRTFEKLKDVRSK